MIDEGREQDQAVAACMQMWRDRDKSEAVQVKPSDLVYQIHDGPIAACVDRAWSVLTVKSVNTERREIEGIASTPSVDRAATSWIRWARSSRCRCRCSTTIGATSP